LKGKALAAQTFIALLIAVVSSVDPFPVAPKSITLMVGRPRFARAEDAVVAPVPPPDMGSGACAYTMLQAAIPAATRTKYIDSHFTGTSESSLSHGADFRLNLARLMSSKCL
jgi:hypothetical protein